MRERDGHWELPGGGLDHGEDPHDGLIREIEEEIGCNVVKISEQPSAFWTINKEVGSPTLKWFGFIAYEAEISGKLKPNQEEGEGLEVVEEINYFSIKEAQHLKLHDNIKPYFLAA